MNNVVKYRDLPKLESNLTIEVNKVIDQAISVCDDLIAIKKKQSSAAIDLISKDEHFNLTEDELNEVLKKKLDVSFETAQESSKCLDKAREHLEISQMYLNKSKSISSHPEKQD